MKKTLGFAAAGLGLLIVLLGMLIAIFDIRTPPEPDPTQWHAYLTAEEVDHPLAEYWYKRAAADPIVLAALNKGPMQRGKSCNGKTAVTCSNRDILPAKTVGEEMQTALPMWL
jgi:hypothetical protein